MAAKYQQIAQLVRTQVRDGEFTHRPVPSERQIAHSYGVSHMTARKATQELLSDGTLERLDNGRLAAARKAIAKIKGPKIALVSPSFDSESSRKVHMALEEVVEQRHGSLRPVGFTRLYDTIISEVLEADYDGIFLFPPRQTMPKVFLDMLKRHASRLAIVFRDMTREGLLSVGYRSPSDIQKVWEHLYELGHRRMAYLNTEPDLHNDRLHDTFENWCIAPVIVDPEQDEVYFTPLYDVMCHFSKFIRPGATVLANDCEDADVMAVATENEDGSYTVVCFNQGDTPRSVHIEGLPSDVHIEVGLGLIVGE